MSVTPFFGIQPAGPDMCHVSCVGIHVCRVHSVVPVCCVCVCARVHAIVHKYHSIIHSPRQNAREYISCHSTCATCKCHIYTTYTGRTLANWQIPTFYHTEYKGRMGISLARYRTCKSTQMWLYIRCHVMSCCTFACCVPRYMCVCQLCSVWSVQVYMYTSVTCNCANVFPHFQNVCKCKCSGFCAICVWVLLHVFRMFVTNRRSHDTFGPFWGPQFYAFVYTCECQFLCGYTHL